MRKNSYIKTTMLTYLVLNIMQTSISYVMMLVYHYLETISLFEIISNWLSFVSHLLGVVKL
jgi:hypothetical protein